MSAAMQTGPEGDVKPIYGARKRAAARARQRAAERRRRGEQTPPGIVYMERIVPVPMNVMLVFDASGWHAELVDQTVDLEALCDAQDVEDAAWFAQRQSSAQP